MTAAAALDYLLLTFTHAPDDALLTDALTRLGLFCGGQNDSLMYLAKFEEALRLERGRLRLVEALKVAKRIGP